MEHVFYEGKKKKEKKEEGEEGINWVWERRTPLADFYFNKTFQAVSYF